MFWITYEHIEKSCVVNKLPFHKCPEKKKKKKRPMIYEKKRHHLTNIYKCGVSCQSGCSYTIKGENMPKNCRLHLHCLWT